MRAVILAMALALSGCISTPAPEAPVVPVYHPPFPAPIAACPISWVVLEQEGKAYVALTYDDNVTGAICNKDVFRYIKQLKAVACQYRKDLKEPECL
jgi:hypothetical protein